MYRSKPTNGNRFSYDWTGSLYDHERHRYVCPGDPGHTYHYDNNKYKICDGKAIGVNCLAKQCGII